MRYSSIVRTVAEAWKHDPTIPVYVEGAPGVGKTSLAYSIADVLGISHENVFIFRPSLRDPVDLLGTPNPDKESETTRWYPPAELKKLTTGRHLLVVDEMPQAEKMMQNALAGLMLDRFVGELHLSPDVYVMATGNSTKHKAGANRVVSQLGNRVMAVQQEVNLDDWCEWALSEPGLDVMGVAFMRFSSDALLDFDPDRMTNATPRSWERVMRQPHDAFDPEDYYDMIKGIVNEGKAAEYIGFRKLLGRAPNIDQIQMDPQSAPVPEDADVRYATIAALITRTSDNNWPAFVEYVQRLPSDFQVLYVKGATRGNQALLGTKQFVDWSVNNQAVFK